MLAQTSLSLQTEPVHVSAAAATGRSVALVSSASPQEWDWYSYTLLLEIPRPILLKGPYANLHLINHTSFAPSTPLTTRLRHSDLLLYSLLSLLGQKIVQKWPPVQINDVKSLRAECGKLVEKVLKEEKEGAGWDRDVVWRRSFLDEAKGEKWEKLLLLLGMLAVRKMIVDVNLKATSGDTEVGYEVAVTKIKQSVTDMKSKLGRLRVRGKELLQTKVLLESESATSRKHSEVDIEHLLALRDEKVRMVQTELWGLKGRSDTGNSELKSAETVRRSGDPTSLPLGRSSAASLLSRHRQLLKDLSTLTHITTDTDERQNPSKDIEPLAPSPFKLSSAQKPAPLHPLFVTSDAKDEVQSMLLPFLRITTTSPGSIDFRVACILDSLVVLNTDDEPVLLPLPKIPSNPVPQVDQIPSSSLPQPRGIPKLSKLGKADVLRRRLAEIQASEVDSPVKADPRDFGEDVESLLDELLDDDYVEDSFVGC